MCSSWEARPKADVYFAFRSKKNIIKLGLSENAEGGLMPGTDLVGLAFVKAWGGKWVVAMAAIGLKVELQQGVCT